MKKIKKFLKKNSPTILSCISVLGVVGTGVTSWMSATKVSRLIEEDSNIDTLDYVSKYWKHYILPVSVCILTSVCILESNVLNKKQQAALASAYMLVSNSFNEYRNKVKELHGEKEDERIRNEIAKSHYNSEERPEGEEILFYDELSERYFNSTMEAVKDAEYHFNRNYILRGYAELNELYDFLGLEKMSFGDQLGWSTWAEGTYGYKWVDFYHDKVVMDDGLECYILSFPFAPHADYLGC